jgi:hypothetical protein
LPLKEEDAQQDHFCICIDPESKIATYMPIAIKEFSSFSLPNNVARSSLQVGGAGFTKKAVIGDYQHRNPSISMEAP